MTADSIAWIASEGGFLVLSEVDKRASANAAWRDRIGEPGDLTAAIAHVAGVPADDAALQDFVRRARAGLRIKASLGRLIWLSVPRHSGDVRVVALQATENAAFGDVEPEAGITHELANALGAIMGWAALGKRPGASDADMTRALDSIEKSARNARETARNLFTASRSGTPKEGDVVAVVREVVASLEPIAEKAEVRVQTMLPDEPLPVATQRPQLYTAISNLVRNAIEASPKGGVVAIEARALRGRVRIEVADQGAGIPEAARARIFEPYFTTKPEGTGLGLPLVRHVVESSNGRLRVRSQRDRGARFTIELPAGEPIEGGAADRPHKARKRSGVRVRTTQLEGRVLVVDDDPSMRELIATTLEMHGATVVTAANASEALSAEGPFMLALVDVNLDVRGDRILAELRRSGQVGAGALVTGATPPRDLDPDCHPDRILRKPFDLEDLIETATDLRKRAAEANG